METVQYPPKNRNSERYRALDGLRAYAAIGIVVMHVLANIPVKPAHNYLTNTIIPWFTDFTLLFMVISGFSLCCGYYEKVKTGAITPNAFYKKRYTRILPFFTCLCLLDFILSPSIEQIFNLIANLTLCFNFIPNENITMIGVGWFLGLVFVFYLLYPFFVFMLDNKIRGWLSFAIVLTLAGICTIHSFNDDIPVPHIGRTNIIYTMPLFMTGGLIYLYRHKLKMEGRKKWFMLTCCIALSIVFFTLPEMRSTSFGALVTEIILFGAWLIYALGSTDIILNNGVARFISHISMEIYLCHMVLYRGVELIHLERLIPDADILYWTTCLLVIIGAIIFSWSMKKYVLNFNRYNILSFNK